MTKTLFRLNPTTAHQLSVNRDGGKFGAGLIAGASIATEGEALGHVLYLDGTFLAQVAQAINAKGNGCKVRYGHPVFGADSLGTVVGRAMNARISGKQCKADVHLLEAARKSPKGDLASYLLDLADEDPEAMGLSIVFENDDTSDERAPNGMFLARLGKLWSCDFVDEPAANPGGLFSTPAFAKRPTAATRSENRPAAAPPQVDDADFIGEARKLATRENIPLADAFSLVARSRPELYCKHIRQAEELARLRFENRVLTSENQAVRRRLKPSQETSK